MDKKRLRKNCKIVFELKRYSPNRKPCFTQQLNELWKMFQSAADTTRYRENQKNQKPNINEKSLYQHNKTKSNPKRQTPNANRLKRMKREIEKSKTKTAHH